MINRRWIKRTTARAHISSSIWTRVRYTSGRDIRVPSSISGDQCTGRIVKRQNLTACVLGNGLHRHRTIAHTPSERSSKSNCAPVIGRLLNALRSLCRISRDYVTSRYYTWVTDSENLYSAYPYLPREREREREFFETEKLHLWNYTSDFSFKKTTLLLHFEYIACF